MSGPLRGSVTDQGQPLAPPQGRVRTRALLAGELPRDLRDLAFALVDLFGNELDAYAELIAAPRDRVTGFMTQGEGAAFAERVRIAFAQLGLDAAAYQGYAALARWFEHRRGLLKIEWHRTDAGIAPFVAAYFRRRPAVDAALARLAELGAAPPALARARALASALDKATIHFVSAAFQRGGAPHHKLYFSQRADESSRAAASQRLERVFDLFEIAGPARACWRALHDATLGVGEPTWFVSTSLADAPSPALKIDYPEVSTAQAIRWRPAGEHRDRTREIERLCDRAGARALSFLGVRFSAGERIPAIKYYADVARGRS
jgi:hypothetical protein